MQNPMLQQLNQPLNQLISAYKSGPQSFLTQLLTQNNPQINNIKSYIDANGGDAKKAFYQKASELGVNPDTVLSKLR